MQNADSQQIYGANVPILKVGIPPRMPLRYITPISDTHTLETSVTARFRSRRTKRDQHVAHHAGVLRFSGSDFHP